MFSGSPDWLRSIFERGVAERLLARLRRNALGLRLMLGYALIFTVSVALLFALSYVLVADFMRAQDRALLESKLQAYASVYTARGLGELRQAVAADARTAELLVRVADAQGRTRYLHLPADLETPADAPRLVRRLPTRGSSGMQRVRAEGDEEALEIAVQRLPGGHLLQVGLSTEGTSDTLETFREVFAAIALPVLLLGLLGGAFMAHRALRPVRDLLRTLAAVADTGDLHERASAGPAGGSFAELVHLFNRMLQRIEALVAGMRETLDDAAHDLRTPMTRLRGQAELALQGERSKQDYRHALAEVLEASDAVLAMLDTLMDVSEAEAGAMRLHCEETLVADLIGDVASLYRLVAEEKNVHLEVHTSEDERVKVDRSRMRQALANLLDNAVKYTPPGGRVSVATESSDREVLIHVSDSGIGITAEELPRIWDRLYRSDRSRSEQGLGLGLSLVKAIIEAHGGRIAAESEPGTGSTFTIRLPRGAAH